MSVLRTENSALGVGGCFYVTEIWKNLSPVSKNKTTMTWIKITARGWIAAKAKTKVDHYWQGQAIFVLKTS